MSDLYLDLKRRIPVVAEWTHIGTEEMERAQKRTGLSDERLAAELHVVAKTWSRWKRRGAIPTALLPRVAPVLGFEIIPVDPVPLHVSSAFDSPPEGNVALVPPDFREALAVLVDLARALAETCERMEQTLLRIEQAMPSHVPERPRARRR